MQSDSTEASRAIAEIAALINRNAFPEIERLAKSELRNPRSRYPKFVLWHALALAAVSEPDPSGSRLAEAIGHLETAFSERGSTSLPEGVSVGAAAQLGEFYKAWRQRRDAPQIRISSDASELFQQLTRAACDLIRRRKLTEAEPLLWRVNDIALQVQGEASPLYRATIMLLRQLREYTGDRRGAAIRYEDSAREEAAEQDRFRYTAEERADYLQVCREFARAAWDGNRFELARRFLVRAMDLERWDAEQAGDMAGFAGTASWLGTAALQAGAYDHAYQLFEEIRKLHKDRRVDDSWNRMALAGLGQVWMRTGESDKGIRLISDALAGTADSDAAPWRGQALLTLYEHYLKAGDPDAAESCLRKLSASGNTRGASQKEIDAKRAERGDRKTAIELYRKVIDVPIGQSVPSSTLMRVSLRLFQLYLDAGHLEEAYQLLERAYPVFSEVWGNDHPGMSTLDETIANIENGLGHTDIALDVLARAAARDSRLASLQFGFVSSRQRDRLLSDMRRRTEAAVSLLTERDSPDERIVGGVHALVTRRKGLNINIEWARQQQQQRQSNTHDSEREEILTRLRTISSQIAVEGLELLRGTPTGSDRLQSLITAREELERHVYLLSPGMAISGLTEEPNPASISMCIPENSAFIDYYRYQPLRAPGSEETPAERYCAFVLNARYLHWRVIDIGEARAVDELVQQYREEIVQGTGAKRDIARVPRRTPGTQAAASSGESLRKFIFDPLLHEIEERTRLVICPDGPLFSLPLECLPAKNGGHLIDHYCISYVSSSRSTMYMQSDTIGVTGAAAPVVIGDPDYDQTAEESASASANGEHTSATIGVTGAGAPVVIGDPDYDQTVKDSACASANGEHTSDTIGVTGAAAPIVIGDPDYDQTAQDSAWASANAERTSDTIGVTGAATPVVIGDPDNDQTVKDSACASANAEHTSDTIGVTGAAAPVVIGDPDYDQTAKDSACASANAERTFRFTPLLGARLEAEAIGAILQVTPAVGVDASKALVAGVQSPVVLHLATHGFVLPRDAAQGVLASFPLLRTGLAFAGANGADPAAGILTAEEVLRMNLRRTALVVLSACETGLGDPEHGEGLASLGRAFEIAGVASLLVGLWKVPDDATRLVMESFYRSLKKGQSCADALRGAKREVRLRLPAIHDWGAFVCLGQWGSVDLDSRSGQ